MNQRGGGDCRLTSKQNAELKTWFDFWDRDSEGAAPALAQRGALTAAWIGEVDPRSISDALSALKVLSDSQKQVR